MATITLNSTTGSGFLEADFNQIKLLINSQDTGDLIANTAHRASAGTSHANVVLNDAHRVSDGSDHSLVNANVAAIATATTAIDTKATSSSFTSHTSDSTIHYTQASISIPASQVSDFDTEVSNNSDVSSNTSFRTTPSSVITAGSNLSWDGNTLNATSSGGFTDPMTTRGDIIIRDASNNTERLGIGANTYVLTSDGTDIAWAAPSGGGTPSGNDTELQYNNSGSFGGIANAVTDGTYLKLSATGTTAYIITIASSEPAGLLTGDIWIDNS